jgi:hypothetical protein
MRLFLPVAEYVRFERHSAASNAADRKLLLALARLIVEAALKDLAR